MVLINEQLRIRQLREIEGLERFEFKLQMKARLKWKHRVESSQQVIV